MPVVTAHSSYMYWGTLQRREARREGRELRGERRAGGCSSGEVEDSGVVVCKAREVEDSSALPGSGNTGSTAMHTYCSKVEMLQSFFQFKDGKLNEARHESWLGQDPGGELSIAATKPASRRHISKLLLLQRRLRILVVSHSVSLYTDFKIEELY